MTKVYFHIAVMGDWVKSYELIQSYLDGANFDNVLYCVCGDMDTALQYIKNKNIIWLSPTIDNFEFPTLNYILSDCNPEDKILYIHTKGASTGINEPIKDWIKTMCWFNITQNKTCLGLLDAYDALGVDYHRVPFKHFSGNFWWSTGSHVNKLSPLLNEDRHAAERWVASISGNYASLHNTGIDVHQRHLHLYPESNYSKT